VRPIPPDATAEVRVVVDETMLAAFEGRVVHAVYGTAAMVAHLELAGRKIILPYLEEGEEGVGHAITVTHLAPTLPGMAVVARARFREQRGRQIVCDIAAFNEFEQIGEGSFTQVIVRRDALDARLAALRAKLQADGQRRD
jgi:predicted thioesterase